MNLVDEWTLGELPCQCVLSAAVADEEDAELVCHVERWRYEENLRGGAESPEGVEDGEVR